MLIADNISLLTTLRYTPTSHASTPQPTDYPLLQRHLDRLRRASVFFSQGREEYDYGNDQVVWDKIKRGCEGKTEGDWRVRVLIHREGSVEALITPMPVGSDPFNYTLPDPNRSSPRNTAAKRVHLDSASSSTTSTPTCLWTYKTTERRAYQEASTRANRNAEDCGQEPPFDVLLHWCSEDTDGNGHDVDQDIITESSTSNIAIFDPQPLLPDWVTPSYSPQTPFLCGTMRLELMERGLLREEVITVGRLRRWVDEGREVVGMNGLRGVWTMRIALPR